MSSLYSLAWIVGAFLIAIGILVAVHEYGHFWVARRLGVRVLRFSIGFGRPIGRRVGRDGVEYVIAAIPLGGYVKMLDEREGDVAEEDLPRAFNRQSLGVRAAIVAAGPLANLLFAILAYWAVALVGETGLRSVIGKVEPASAAERAGLQAGDRLVQVGSDRADTWEQALQSIVMASDSDEPLTLRVASADGLERVCEVPPADLAGLAERKRLLSSLGITPFLPPEAPVFGHVVAGEAADRAGLREGDRILEVDGEPIADWTAFVTYVKAHPAAVIRLEYQRGDERLLVSVHLGTIEEGGNKVGRIGAAPRFDEAAAAAHRVRLEVGVFEGLGLAVKRTWDTSVFMLRMIGRLLTGQASIDNLGGPIAIADAAGKTASYGLLEFIRFLAAISISLGVLNLFPIPVLDGGHLLFFLLEAIRGRALSDEAQMHGQRVGLALLLALMVLAFYVDLTRLLG